MRINYNFLRPHQAIRKTPAEQAGIKLELGQNKIENLIRLASKTGRSVKSKNNVDGIK
jgi:hypothetical protein